MFETPFSIVGTVATDPVARRVGDQDFVRFRVVSNSRRKMPDGSWESGNSLFVTVNCWGKVAEGISSVLYKGDPVVVVGYIHTDEYEDKDGNRRTSVEVRANSVGPDLSRCRAKLERTRAVGNPAPQDESDAEDAIPDMAPDAVAEQGLSLSA